MIFEYVSSLMDTDAFGIGVYNDHKKQIEYPGFMEKGKKLPPFHKPINQENSLSAWCFNNQKLVYINNLEKEYKDYISKMPKTSTKQPVKSLIHVPLAVEGKPIGIIAVNSYKENAYSANDLNNIQSLASYLSIALDNAHVYGVVAKQNEHIKSSIRYAQTIQQSILPLQQNMDKYFESFVLFRPKDVVSGDFYWFYPLDVNTCFAAVVDCTGHGVPGAFMSLIGHQALNGIIEKEKVHDPAQILEMLDKSIVHALKQDQTDNMDGMDVCLIRLDKGKSHGTPVQRLNFAGAKRNLYLNHQGDCEILKATRRSIGGFQSRKKKEVFTTFDKIVYPGDWLYLSSDGFSDQNNPERVRFGSNKVVALLQEISGKDPEEQKKILEKALDQHKQGEEQRDDITFMGIGVI